MKYLLNYFLLLALLCPLVSCQHKKTYKIGISQCSDDDWRAKMNEEIQLEAMLHDDVEIEIRSANDDSNRQIEDLEYFSQTGFDVIVVAPNEADALTPEIRKIYESGVPVIIFDRNIHDDSYTQRIGVDNVGLGKSAANYASSLFPESVRALEIFGLPSSTPAQERSSGFHYYINNENGQILASVPAHWRQDLAEKETDSLLRIYPETNLIFAHNDRMAIGAALAAERLGRDDIKIIGVDAAPHIGMQAVADSIIDATFLYPTEGHLILQEAIKIARGEPFQREVLLPTTSPVDATNVDILMLQNENIEENSKKVLALKGRLDNYVSLHNAQTALVYAIITILILLFGVLFLVLRTFWSHRRHQAALLIKTQQLQEERDKQKELNVRLEEATQTKLIFFTNVSHDLRTPLTLIAEPVAQLNEASNLEESQKNLLKIADKNVKILQRLINQILDFRKFESNKLTLSLSEIDFGKTLKDWMESFQSVAAKRDIRLMLDAPEKDVIMAMDAEKMERVFFNLLSNALKYSPDNSVITVSYKQEEDYLVLKVSDNGVGISKENLPHIFDHFYQVDHVRPKGSGIGLFLVKAFVELHGGSISVESELKKGSSFTIRIPIVHVAEETEDVVKTITQSDVDAELDTEEAERVFTENKPWVLVIDDNRDIRNLIYELLKDDYNVISSPNGKEGIRKASKYVPDVIICDVMMPGMDGMECCEKLKSDTVTSHIPVLMLTACSLDEQKAQGFESGADGYLSKPFSSSVLKSNIASLIANRKRMKDVMASQAPESSPESRVKISDASSSATSSDIDNDFFHRFLALFEHKMGDPDLNVESMASELGFERTQFYRKIKAITNYSPVELMRNLRLKRARKLLKSTDKSVSEICYEVGFSTPAYFTKCYRDQFGQTPSETRI